MPLFNFFRRAIRKLKTLGRSDQLGFFTKDVFAKEILNDGWQIGEFSYGAPAIIGGALASLKIGKFCSIGPGVTVVLANHNLNHVSTYPFFNIPRTGSTRTENGRDIHAETSGNVEIGNDVWIGQGVVIMPNVRIGDGAVIGTNSVVVSDIPPYAIATGNPAIIIRKRFRDEIVKRLIDFAWWNLPDEVIMRKREIFQLNPEDFFQQIEP